MVFDDGLRTRVIRGQGQIPPSEPVILLAKVAHPALDVLLRIVDIHTEGLRRGGSQLHDSASARWAHRVLSAARFYTDQVPRDIQRDSVPAGILVDKERNVR